MLSLAWFLTAHIFEYTSIQSCRLSSPLVWWLTFAILCTMYFIVLEVVLFGFFVFMVLPLIMVRIHPLFFSQGACFQIHAALIQYRLTLSWSPSASKSALHQTRNWKAAKVCRGPHSTCDLHSPSTR